MSHLDRLKRKSTGPSWPQRRRVLLRADNTCERCCRSTVSTGGQIHHRSARRMGGRAGANIAPNLVLLCHDCHAFVESHREEGAYSGYIVPSWEDPETVPMLDCLDRWFLIELDGSRVDLGDMGGRGIYEPQTDTK